MIVFPSIEFLASIMPINTTPELVFKNELICLKTLNLMIFLSIFDTDFPFSITEGLKKDSLNSQSIVLH